MSRIGSAFGVLGDLIEIFGLSFLTGKLENLTDLAVFQRTVVEGSLTLLDGKKICVHTNVCCV